MPMTRGQGITNYSKRKIPKRKKPRPYTRLSCKNEYFMETTSAYLSGRSAFFTGDYENEQPAACVSTHFTAHSFEDVYR